MNQASFFGVFSDIIVCFADHFTLFLFEDKEYKMTMVAFISSTPCVLGEFLVLRGSPPDAPVLAILLF
jgi:hypothetical protein